MNKTTQQFKPIQRGNMTGFGVLADRLNKGFNWAEQAEEIPLEFRISISASIWMVQVDCLRELEELLTDEQHQDSFLNHRKALTQLIQQGEELVFVAKRQKLDQLRAGFRVADIEATLEGLHVSFKCEHRSERKPSLTDSIKSLFNAKPTAA